MTKNTPSAGHAPGLPAISRRSLLRASPALLAPALLAGPVLASTDTLIQRLYREWSALNARLNDDATSSDEFDQLYPLSGVLEREMEGEPCTCLADLAAKVLVLTQLRIEFSTVYEPALLAECEALVVGASA